MWRGKRDCWLLGETEFVVTCQHAVRSGRRRGKSMPRCKLSSSKLTSRAALTIHCTSIINKMRVSQLVTAALLPLTALAAKKSPAERFAEATAKPQPTKLDDRSYDALTKAPRDYSVAVLLTAMDARFGCQLCHEFQPEWELLAKSWTKGDKDAESRLAFGTLDFLDGKATFQSVSLYQFG